MLHLVVSIISSQKPKSPPPHIRQRRQQAHDRIRQSHLDHGPHPQRADGGRALHDGEVAVEVGGPDQVAAAGDGDEQEGELGRRLARAVGEQIR